MTGVELYDYRGVDMTDFDQFDRVNVAGAPEWSVPSNAPLFLVEGGG